MKKLKIVSLVVSVILSLLVLGGCGEKVDNSTSKNTTVKKVIVGTGNAYKPYAYLDKNNKPVGYSIDLLKEVAKKLPQYKFEIETMDFTNVLISLQSGKIDLAAHNFAVNSERESKFLYATQPEKPFNKDDKATNKIAVLKTSNVNSISDLKEKNVQVTPGSQNAYVAEKYNKEHPNKKINIVYSSADAVTTLKSLESGKIDAFLSDEYTIDGYNKTYGDKYKVVGNPLYKGGVYYIYRKDETKLQKDVDKVLKQLRENGILDKLAKKWNFH